MLTAFLLSQESPNSGIPLTGLGQLGAVGVVLTIFLWFGYKVWSAEKKRADENAEEIKRLNTLIQERVIPALNSTTTAVAEATAELARRSRRS